MQLAEAVDDTTALVSGYKRQIWRCSSCGDVEPRMVFARGETVASNVSISMQPDKPSIKLAKDSQPRSAWNQAVDKLRSREMARREQELLAAKISDGIERFKENFAKKRNFDQLWDNLLPRPQD